jgi:hypothetical protein
MRYYRRQITAINLQRVALNTSYLIDLAGALVLTPSSG